MFEHYLLKSIRMDEGVIAIIRPSVLRYARQCAVYTVLLCAAFFLYIPLRSVENWGMLVFALLIITSLSGFASICLLRQLNACIITNQRIIDVDRQSLFEKQMSECPLSHIQDIRYKKKGILAMLFDLGTVIVESAGRGRIELPYVPQPEQVKELIMKVQLHQYGQHHDSKNINRYQEVEEL